MLRRLRLRLRRTPASTQIGQRWPVDFGPISFAPEHVQRVAHAPLPSQEVLVEELTSLYAEEGEDALLRRCVAAADGVDVIIHSIKSGAGFCVHIGEDPDYGVASESLADALVSALLVHNERVRSGDR